MFGITSFAGDSFATLGSQSPLVLITGVTGTTALGTVTAAAAANVYLIGVTGTTALGTVTAAAAANAYLIGVAGTTALGIITITTTANVYPIGVSAITVVSNVLVWGQIIPSQNPTWVEILN